MGDILQTPQFQMRRLKKQLADERNNRDELELELAENRKLLTERGGCWHTADVYEWAASGISLQGVVDLSEEGALCWPWACQTDLLESGSVLASIFPFPWIRCFLLALHPPLSSALTLLLSP